MRTGDLFAYYLGYEDEFNRSQDRSDARLGSIKWYTQAESVPEGLVVIDSLVMNYRGRHKQYLASDIPAYLLDPPKSWQLLLEARDFRVYHATREVDSVQSTAPGRRGIAKGTRE